MSTNGSADSAGSGESDGTDGSDGENGAADLTTQESALPSASGQPELDLGVVSTGSSDVDAALQPLESLADQEVADHAEVFEQVLSDLSAAMSQDRSADSTDPD